MAVMVKKSLYSQASTIRPKCFWYKIVRSLVQISAEIGDTLTADSCVPESLKENPGVVT
jgi:hypothetical protein